LLTQCKLDVLLILLPPYGHSNEVELAAQHGVHVLIEKPIALTSSDAWNMVRVSEAAGIKTQVGFMSRFGAAVENLKNQLEQGDAGQIGLFMGKYLCNSLHTPWWRNLEKSGGQTVEQVIHLFDLMRYLMGDPERIYAQQNNFFHTDVADYTVEDISVTTMRFSSGALGVIQSSNGAVPGLWRSEFEINAKNVSAMFTSPNQATFVQTNQLENPTHTVNSSDDVFKKQLEDLFRAIRTGGTTRTPMREGAKTLDLVLAARQSASEQRELILKGQP
jgi:predicted dehydrogenase